MILLGGEVQCVKLVCELVKCDMGKMLYILDEFIIGLYFYDIVKLLDIFYEFCNKGNIIVVIEYNLDVIKIVDWVIDLGFEGGVGGGMIIVEGIFEYVVKFKVLYIVKFLKLLLK